LPAIAEHPQDEALNLDAAAALIELGRLEEAEALLTREYGDEAERARALKNRIALARNTGDEAPLLDRLVANPDDHAARLALAKLRAGQGRAEEALEAALEVMRRDRHFDEGAGRRVLLELFEALGASDRNDDLIRKYRRALSALLN
jgi:putative thioredoxin